MEPKKTKLRRIRQGAVIANHAVIVAKNKNLAAIHIDLKSKYCEGHGASIDDGVPVVYLEATKESIKLKKGVSILFDTIVSFPEFKGWKMFSATRAGRYTINVTLIKE